jgi:hypothetical protein
MTSRPPDRFPVSSSTRYDTIVTFDGTDLSRPLGPIRRGRSDENRLVPQTRLAGKKDKAFADPFDQLTRCEVKKINQPH